MKFLRKLLKDVRLQPKGVALEDTHSRKVRANPPGGGEGSVAAWGPDRSSAEAGGDLRGEKTHDALESTERNFYIMVMRLGTN